jgi:hypothetical protein
MPWRAAPITDLERKVETLSIRLLRANNELRLKQLHVEKLQYLLCARNARIDELTGTIDQLRLQNKMLESEAEHYAALLAATPVEATTSLI